MLRLNDPGRFDRLPDAILFDTDNTLYAYEPVHRMAMQAVRAKVTRTFSIGEDDFDRAFSAARAQVKQRLAGMAASHSRLLYFQRMLEIIGLGSQVMLALDFEQTYWRNFLSNAVLFDGVKELLDDLRMLNIPTAIVTDLTAQIQFRKVVYFGLDHCFDFIVTSEEAGSDKPHAAPFRLALEKMQPAGDCIWMIGDSALNDIQGAREQIGAVTLQKLHAGVSEGRGSQQADACFDDFESLRQLVASLARPVNPTLPVGRPQSERLSA